MRWKRMAAFMLLFSFVGTASVFADDAYEWYKGRKINISVNGADTGISGIMNADGRGYVPIRAIADKLQAIVKWNDVTQTVQIYKPNAHITLFGVDKGQLTAPFVSVEKGKYDILILSIIDSLETSVESLKVTVEDPAGSIVESHEEKGITRNDNAIWFRTPTLSLNFKYTGTYKVKLYAKADAESGYAVIAEKTFLSRESK